MAGRLRFRLLAVVITLLLSEFCAADQLALPGYRFEFPRDHFAHPDYQTEWWYYTGNIATVAGRRFGFEVTFFRFHPDQGADNSTTNPTWDPAQIYIAHFALTDITGLRFFHQERVNRKGPGIAGADEKQQKVWNGNWSAKWLSFAPARQELLAVNNNAILRLELDSRKPPVIHGHDGVSQKGPKPGEASHYYSLTRIKAEGHLTFEGIEYQVTGQAWMDREFFTSVPGDSIAGWDWMCIQLDSNEELMLYRLRLKDGSLSAYSSGTFVNTVGLSETLSSSQFSIKPVRMWRSSQTGGTYPVEWDIDVPSRQLHLRLTPVLNQQELVNRVTRSYWEGAVRYHGTEAGSAANGVGYLEMTGYERQRNSGLETSGQR
jgi:predicted secreted hydrolase